MLNQIFDWSFLLISFSAFCNAVMDTVDHHFSTSKFDFIHNPKWRMWFNENQGWRNKYIDRNPAKGRRFWIILGIKVVIPVQITDAWHFFKTLMIFSFVGAIVFHDNSNPIWIKIIQYVLLGITWNVTFSFFYNTYLIKIRNRT